MDFNYDQFAFLFSYKCLSTDQISMLATYGFERSGNFYRGHLPVMNLTSFILDFDDLVLLQQCMMEWDYEYIAPLEGCSIQNTNTNVIHNISKPDSWHLDMLDLKVNAAFEYQSNLSIQDQVDLWVLDTGIFSAHEEFLPGQVIDVDTEFTTSNLSHPHGTGSACAAAGLRYGVAKEVKIYNFPACKYGGSCGSADIEKGLQTVLTHVKERWPLKKRTVINMSFGVSYGDRNPMNSSLGLYYHQLFKDIDNYGGVIVVAAGNSNVDACNWFYSYSPFVISVGSIDRVYNKSSFSNWGSCVDLWTFGSNVPIAYSITDPTVIQYKSGTSFSSPLVAGMIVNLLIEQPTLNKDEILNRLYDTHNQFVTPKYTCGNNPKQCCRGKTVGTRLDLWCKTLSVFNCDRTCKIGKC